MPCNRQCDGCAYKPGATANLEIDNRLRGKIAMLGPIPFYCHDNDAWRKGDREGMKTRREFRESGYKICGGWSVAVAELAATGYFNEARQATKVLATIAYQNLQEWIALEPGPDRDEVQKQLITLLKRLGKKYRKFMKKEIDL